MTSVTLDLARIVKETPHLVDIVYQRRKYRWSECGYCKVMFWKDHSEGTRIDRRNYLVYCSDKCRLANWKIFNKLRQRRWQQKRAKERERRLRGNKEQRTS